MREIVIIISVYFLHPRNFFIPCAPVDRVGKNHDFFEKIENIDLFD